jgi:hypothetical protein
LPTLPLEFPPCMFLFPHWSIETFECCNKTKPAMNKQGLFLFFVTYSHTKLRSHTEFFPRFRGQVFIFSLVWTTRKHKRRGINTFMYSPESLFFFLPRPVTAFFGSIFVLVSTRLGIFGVTTELIDGSSTFFGRCLAILNI